MKSMYLCCFSTNLQIHRHNETCLKNSYSPKPSLIQIQHFTIYKTNIFLILTVLFFIHYPAIFCPQPFSRADKPKDSLLFCKFFHRIKGSKRAVVNGQNCEKATNLWPLWQRNKPQIFFVQNPLRSTTHSPITPIQPLWLSYLALALSNNGPEIALSPATLTI